VAQNREKNKKKAGKIIKLTLVITLVMGFVTGLVIFFGAHYLSKNILNNGQLTTALRWASLLIVFNAFNSAFYGILTGFEAFKRLAFITLLSSFISLPLVIAGVYWEGLPGLIVGMIAAQIILTIIYYEDLRGRTKGNHININEPNYGSELRLVLAFSLPTMAASMVSGPANWASNAILVNQPGGYGEMGIFQAAQQWKVAVMLIPSLINTSALPVLSNAKFNPKQFAQAVKYNIGACAGLSMLTAIGIILFSKFIMGFYGQAFKAGSMVLIITVLMAVFQSISQALTQVMISTNRVWANMAVNVGWALIMVALAVLWVPKGLAVGLACASLAAWFVIVVWQSIMVIKIIDLKKEFGEAS
jgi:O-antigen/teichoic acid export membrane protein